MWPFCESYRRDSDRNLHVMTFMLIYEVCFNLDTLVFILKFVKELICGFKKEEEKKNKLVCAALIIKISNAAWDMRVFY